MRGISPHEEHYMAGSENRKRKKDRKSGGQDSSPWGSLLHRNPAPQDGDDMRELYPPEEFDDEEPERVTWRRLWQMVNIWSIIATLLFVVFIGSLVMLVVNMWIPQDLRDISGYTDKGAARDLTVALRNANGGEIIFTEGEINRYLRDTCRLKQTGLFSLIVPAQGVAVRLHDSYAELIIDRTLSTHFHQTTSVHLSFAQELDHGRPCLKVEYRGGEPVLGSLPCGGRIGQVGVPQRYMQMLRPALATIQDCYPDIWEIIETYGYRPVFVEGKNGVESYVRLVPYAE